MLKYIIFVLLISFVQESFAQIDSVVLVRYNPGFRFEEGLYFSHSQLVKNRPIPIKRIITKYNKLGFDFFEKLLSDKSVTYYDAYGMKKTTNVGEFWGFCRRGAIYINWGDDYCRVPVVGNICHFIASVTVYEDNFNSGYGNSFFSAPTTTRTDVYQFLMDFNSGRVLEYSSDNVLELLKPDTVLYEEFNLLKKKKKRQMKFFYVRKFNEKHALYIPIN